MFCFLKLGGSLITDKSRPHTARMEVIQRLAREIAVAIQTNSDLKLVFGHGSGSFGHIPARQHGTRDGVSRREEWHGFIEVWREARALNEIMMQALHSAGIPAISLPPSAVVTARSGSVKQWDLQPLKAALAAGLMPVIFGDVIFDTEIGGTILSTEDLFAHLAVALRPERILLAGIEEGVWADYPRCQQLVAELTPRTYHEFSSHVSGSKAVDVTGGMAEKVKLMLELTDAIPGLDALIFSGSEHGRVQSALLGEIYGTWIKSDW